MTETYYGFCIVMSKHGQTKRFYLDAVDRPYVYFDKNIAEIDCIEFGGDKVVGVKVTVQGLDSE